MYFEGDERVLVNLFLKKRLLVENHPAHKVIRTALLICPGTMRGVYGGGSAIALERAGLTNTFDVAIGSSTGLPVAGYFLAGDVERCLSIYWEECTTSHFMSWGRLFGGPVVDTDWLCKVFRGEVSHKRLRQEAILSSRTSFFAATTCARTGRGIFLEAKNTRPDLVEAIRASIALPALSRGAVWVEGRPFLDGAGALSFPAPKVIDEFAPTDLLVFANCSTGYRKSQKLLEPLLSRVFLASFPSQVREAFARRSETAVRDIDATRSQSKCRVAIVWTDDEVKQFDRDPKKLRAAADRAQAHLSPLLEAARIEALRLTTLTS